jgi:hypothetical protein
MSEVYPRHSTQHEDKLLEGWLERHAYVIRGEMMNIIDTHQRHDKPLSEAMRLYVERLRCAAALLEAPLVILKTGSEQESAE